MIATTIKSRRAVFPAQYNEEVITKEEILKLLEAAHWAPTHKRTEPWRFKVLHGKSQKDLGLFLSEKYKETEINFSEFKYNKLQNNPCKAGCIIAICIQRDSAQRIPEWEEIAATAMAVQNMWLLAHEMEIGAYWSSLGLVKYMDTFFNLNEGERCLGFLYLGRFDDPLPEGIRKSKIENLTTWL